MEERDSETDIETEKKREREKSKITQKIQTISHLLIARVAVVRGGIAAHNIVHSSVRKLDLRIKRKRERAYEKGRERAYEKESVREGERASGRERVCVIVCVSERESVCM